MAQLVTVWVVHTTSLKSKAQTDSVCSISLPLGGKAGGEGGGEPTFRLPDLPHDERERGRTDQYRLDVRGKFLNPAPAAGTITISIDGNDAWLPSSLWVIGEDDSGRRSLLAAHPAWPATDWFSTDPKEGRASYRL